MTAYYNSLKSSTLRPHVFILGGSDTPTKLAHYLKSDFRAAGCRNVSTRGRGMPMSLMVGANSYPENAALCLIVNLFDHTQPGLQLEVFTNAVEAFKYRGNVTIVAIGSMVHVFKDQIASEYAQAKLALRNKAIAYGCDPDIECRIRLVELGSLFNFVNRTNPPGITKYLSMYDAARTIRSATLDQPNDKFFACMVRGDQLHHFRPSGLPLAPEPAPSDHKEYTYHDDLVKRF